MSQKLELAKTRTKSVPLAPGTLAINITVGVIVAFFWVYGLAYFIVKATTVNDPQRVEDQYLQDSYDYY